MWQASRWDRRSHPDLTGQVSLAGWVLVCQNPTHPRRNFAFTTLPVSPRELLDTYKLRWTIETDLFSLKRTVDLTIAVRLRPLALI